MSDYRIIAELPDPFVFNDGSRVETPGDWPRRRQEIAESVVDLEYGGLPPRPDSIKLALLNRNRPRRFPEAIYEQYRIGLPADRALHFRLDLLIRPSPSPRPVILTGDGCYLNVSDELRHDILGRGFALAIFSRTSIVPDLPLEKRDTGLYAVYPESRFGALAAWAWGYHRAVDALAMIESVDHRKVAITGHSRGGKTVLLAGATDQRIALTGPNASGLGGTGSMLFQGPGCERLGDICKSFPHWFGPDFKRFIDQERKLPFDQHFIKAMVAPRAYINTNGYDDLWCNPAGAWQTHMAALEVYRLLDAPGMIGQAYRPGTHVHGPADWAAFLDFAQARLQGVEVDREFDLNPYPGMDPAFAWRAPGNDGGG